MAATEAAKAHLAKLTEKAKKTPTPALKAKVKAKVTKKED